MTLTACLLGLATGQLLSGPWSDAVGRRRPLLICVGGYVAASLACAVAPSVLTLIVLRVVQGLAGAAGSPVPRRRPRPAVRRRGGPPVRRVAWRGLFVVLAAVGALIPAGTAAFVPESHPPALRRTGGLADTLQVFRALLGQRRFVGCTLASGLAFAAMFAYIAGSPFSPALFSGVFAANGVGIIVAGQLSAPLIARYGSGPVLGAGLLVGAAGGVALLAVVLLDGIGLVGMRPHATGRRRPRP